MPSKVLKVLNGLLIWPVRAVQAKRVHDYQTLDLLTELCGEAPKVGKEFHRSTFLWNSFEANELQSPIQLRTPYNPAESLKRFSTGLERAILEANELQSSILLGLSKIHIPLEGSPQDLKICYESSPNIHSHTNLGSIN